MPKEEDRLEDYAAAPADLRLSEVIERIPAEERQDDRSIVREL